ncbi:MAG: uracil-DNA glycosylase [Zoogloeaceae bacterium]|nr:uracil-DNA glycosylase [Zoogloeaceae bacterium]
MEMGYTLWRLRGASEMPAAAIAPPFLDTPEHPRPEAPKAAVAVTAESSGNLAAAPRAARPEPETRLEAPVSPDVRAEEIARIARMGWEELEAAIRACRACTLCRQRRQAVPGVGDRAADWLFVGEGPGAEEDLQGEPFVGQAGKLLDAMLAAINLKRGEKVYIANAVKCRPEGNRTPQHGEMETCFPFLRRQIELIRPKIIVLLGKAAVYSVLREEKTLAALRKKPLCHEEIPVVVTYHPAYLLRNLPEKAKAWEDFCLARHVLRAQRTK